MSSLCMLTSGEGAYCIHDGSGAHSTAFHFLFQPFFPPALSHSDGVVLWSGPRRSSMDVQGRRGQHAHQCQVGCKCSAHCTRALCCPLYTTCYTLYAHSLYAQSQQKQRSVENEPLSGVCDCRCFGFVSRKPASYNQNEVHLFAELEAEQPVGTGRQARHSSLFRSLAMFNMCRTHESSRRRG